MSQPATAAPGGATAAPLQPPPAAPPQPTPTAGPSPASPAEVTPVSTAEELRTAAAAGAQHIEIRAHLDLRELPRADNPLIEGNGVRALALLYASGGLESIRVRSPVPCMPAIQHHVASRMHCISRGGCRASNAHACGPKHIQTFHLHVLVRPEQSLPKMCFH